MTAATAPAFGLSRRTFTLGAAAGGAVPLLVRGSNAWAAFRTGDLIGEPSFYMTQAGETLLDIARERNLGVPEISAANPGVDPWVPARRDAADAADPVHPARTRRAGASSSTTAICASITSPRTARSRPSPSASGGTGSSSSSARPRSSARRRSRPGTRPSRCCATSLGSARWFHRVRTTRSATTRSISAGRPT